jgi:uncharacterized protein YdhG (YjbR/CyaY superfamily)
VKTTKTQATQDDGSTLSDVEKEAMRETIRERKAAKSGKADGAADVRAKIDEMAEPDRSMAERIHAIVLASAPELAPRTWYGMPAYAKDGKVICFFQAASKFKVRYSTFGFQPDAALDDGSMWPTAYALTELTPADEARIGDLVRRAAG